MTLSTDPDIVAFRSLAFQSLLKLTPEERQYVMAWFCPGCGTHLPPGDGECCICASCDECGARNPLPPPRAKRKKAAKATKHTECQDCDDLIDWHREDRRHCSCGSMSWPCPKAK